jgi:hypothetical protein
MLGGPATQVPASLHSNWCFRRIARYPHMLCARTHPSHLPWSRSGGPISALACSTSAFRLLPQPAHTAHLGSTNPRPRLPLPSHARCEAYSQPRRGAWPLSHHFACGAVPRYMLLCVCVGVLPPPYTIQGMDTWLRGIPNGTVRSSNGVAARSRSSASDPDRTGHGQDVPDALPRRTPPPCH